MMAGFIAAIVLVFTFAFGWVVAHTTIAVECDQLGGFYVGRTVYECKTKAST